MSNYSDVVQIVKNRARVIVGPGPDLAAREDIITAELNREIDAAVLDYAVDEPKKLLFDKLAGDLIDVAGIKMFKLSNWDQTVSSSSEIAIEHPVDQAPTLIMLQGHDLDFEIVERPTGAGGAIEVWVKFLRPPSTAWRIRYFARYQTIAESSTLADLPAPRGVNMAGLLTAVYVARAMAAKFAKTTDPAMIADVVDYRSKSGEWLKVADKLFDEYVDRLDRPSRLKRPGQDFDLVDIDLTIGRANRYGRNYLVHRRRIR